MSEFPNTRHALLRCGYKPSGTGTCRGCGAPIHWWLTSKGKKMPFNPIGEHELAPADPHHNTCPNVRDFRPANTTPVSAPSPVRHEREAPLAKAIRLIREQNNARVVVVIDDVGTLASWRTGLPGDELRQDLISAANFVRTAIAKEEVQA